jgi:hypothetical protein
VSGEELAKLIKRWKLRTATLAAGRKPEKLFCLLFGMAGLSSYLRMVEGSEFAWRSANVAQSNF